MSFEEFEKRVAVYADAYCMEKCTTLEEEFKNKQEMARAVLEIKETLRDALRTLTEAWAINSDRRASVHKICGVLGLSEQETLELIAKANR